MRRLRACLVGVLLLTAGVTYQLTAREQSDGSTTPSRTSEPGHLSVESRVREAVKKALQAKGHKLQTAGAWSLGSNAAIVVDPKTGVLSAGADPRVEAYAWAR